MAISRFFGYWVDAYGATRLTTFNFQPGTNPLLIATNLVAASNGGISSYAYGNVNPLTTIPVPLQYQGVQDSALMLFQDSTGLAVKIYVPAPSLTMFFTDETTVDPASADAAPIIASVIASGRSSAGNPIVAFLGGTYQRSGRILQNG